MLTPRTTWRDPKLFSTLCTARNPGRRSNCGPAEPFPLAGLAGFAGFGRGRGLSPLGDSLGDSAVGAARDISVADADTPRAIGGGLSAAGLLPPKGAAMGGTAPCGSAKTRFRRFYGRRTDLTS